MQTAVSTLKDRYSRALEIEKLDKEAGRIEKALALSQAGSPVLKAMEDKQGSVRVMETINDLDKAAKNMVIQYNSIKTKSDAEAAAERRHKENIANANTRARLQRESQERIAKEKQIEVENQQKFLNDIQTTGLSFVAGKPNTDLFSNNDNFEIVEKVNQGESLLVTVLPKVKTYVQFFMNPYSNKLAKYNTKINTQFKVSIPIVPISTKEREGKYIRENGLISVGEGLYYSPYNLPNTKNTMGVIVKPSFE
jgi:hypothetical protein